MGVRVLNVRARDAAIAALLGVLALAFYVASLSPSYAFWDTGELQTVACILGIAHPPGSPAFVLLGWTFAHLFPFGECAWRVTVSSALAVAAAVSLAFLTMRRLAAPPAIAALCTLAFALATPVWRYAARAEVHDLVLCLGALALFCAIGFAQRGRRLDLACAALATGALGATHGVALFLIPALGAIVARRAELRTWQSFVTIALGIGVGLLPYAYIMPRSDWLFTHRVDPTLALGLPPGLPFWDYGHPADPERFWRFVTGSEFHVGSGFAGYVDPIRYVAYGTALVHRLAAAYGIAGTIVATVGAVVLVSDYGLIGWGVVAAALLPVPYTEAYADLQDPDRYYLLALWCAAVAMALAFERIAGLLAQPRTGIVRTALAVALAAAFFIADSGRGRLFAQRNDRAAADYVRYLRDVTPDDAVVLAEWAFSTPLAYASYVDRSLGHRIVVTSGPAQYASYFARWLAAGRPLYLVTFDGAQAMPAPHVLRLIPSDHAYFVYRVQR